MISIPIYTCLAAKAITWVSEMKTSNQNSRHSSCLHSIQSQNRAVGVDQEIPWFCHLASSTAFCDVDYTTEVMVYINEVSRDLWKVNEV
jgi:hypothetical protein